jgi:hypothetical protein
LSPPFKDDGVDWQAVRAAYEGRALTVRQIRHKFGISEGRLRRRIGREHWTPRCPPKKNQQTRIPVSQVTVANPLEKRAALAARLFHALEERIMAIEEETFSQDAAHHASHGERDAKALTAMARALDMLGEMLEQVAPTPTSTPEQEIDADEFRNLLTDRLDRLRERRGGA